MEHPEPERKNKGDGDSDRRPDVGDRENWMAGPLAFVTPSYWWSRDVFLFKIANPLKL